MKNFFKGISLSQILAGALAAVTSFLLAAKIGIAGSVIGVAIGSIVSAVASQIYQNVLKESSKKIQNATPFSTTDTGDAGADGSGSPEATAAKDDGDATNPSQGRKPRVASFNGARPSSSPSATSGSSSFASSGEHAPAGGRGMADSRKGGKPHVIHAGHLSARSSHKLSARQRKGVIAIVVAVASALVAVAITAGVINIVTRGQGTDSVVRDLVSSSQTKKSPRPQQDGLDSPSASYSAQEDSGSGKGSGSTASSSPSPSAGSGSTATSGSSPSSTPTPGSSDTTDSGSGSTATSGNGSTSGASSSPTASSGSTSTATSGSN